MRLIEIITIRKNKFNEHRKNPSFTDFWKGYHEGWYNAYKDLEEILEQKGLEYVLRPSYRVPTKEEWRERYCTNKQLAGIRHRERKDY